MLELNKVYHGDCLDVMKDIDDGSIDAIITDPPYGTTACKWDSVIPFESMWKELKRVIKPNGAIVLFGSQPFTSTLIMSNIKMFSHIWYWRKTKPTGFPNANCMPLKEVEDVCIFSFGKANPMANNKIVYNPQGVIPKLTIKNRNAKTTTINNGERDGSLNGEYFSRFMCYPRQVLEFNSEGSTIHPTQKPVPLMEYLIKTYTNKGELVLDFAAGSGTTGVSCKLTQRNFILIEKEAAYVDIARQRIANPDYVKPTKAKNTQQGFFTDEEIKQFSGQ